MAHLNSGEGGRAPADFTVGRLELSPRLMKRVPSSGQGEGGQFVQYPEGSVKAVFAVGHPVCSSLDFCPAPYTVFSACKGQRALSSIPRMSWSARITTTSVAQSKLYFLKCISSSQRYCLSQGEASVNGARTLEHMPPCVCMLAHPPPPPDSSICSPFLEVSSPLFLPLQGLRASPPRCTSNQG